jgi:hypothetical protein
MTDYTRKKNIITHVSTKIDTVYDSINQAKKASRVLQLAGKTLVVIR